MRVVVTGGRGYADKHAVWDALDALANASDEGISALAHGACPTGADHWAHLWSKTYALNTYRPFPADWKIEGRAAGPLRNVRMLDEFRPDVVLAFPGGRGTAHCVSAAKVRGIRVIEVSA